MKPSVENGVAEVSIRNSQFMPDMAIVDSGSFVRVGIATLQPSLAGRDFPYIFVRLHKRRKLRDP